MTRLAYLSFLIFVAASAMCLAAQDPQAQQAEKNPVKRLILTDGSYELIGRYTIEGDRVRYYSAERFAWEELPSSMIDWAATEKYASQSARDAEARRNDALEDAETERKEKEARLPLAAPGLRLPASEGVFLLDEYQGKPEFNKLSQSGGDLNKNTGGNILRGIVNPIATSRQTVEIKGLRARVQSHTASPSLYFSIDPADTTMGYNSETAGDHIRIVRCKKKKGNRVVATIEIAVYGKVRQKNEYVETRVERLSDYWVKIVPVVPMQTGEYALVEYDEKGSMNQFVWDFGVDPAAAENPATLVGDPERKEPALIQKSKTPPAP